MKNNSNLYKIYKNKIKKELAEELKTSSIMQVPKLEKIVINMGLGSGVNDKSIVKDALDELAKIVGQKPTTTYAKKSNASFKLREGMPIGVKVTLRRENMYCFLEKLIDISLPRVRDFRGIKPNFDGFGNLTLGIQEYIVFPEISLEKVKHMKGCDISFITSTNKNEEGFLLLTKLGIPFKEKGGNN